MTTATVARPTTVDLTAMSDARFLNERSAAYFAQFDVVRDPEALAAAVAAYAPFARELNRRFPAYQPCATVSDALGY